MSKAFINKAQVLFIVLAFICTGLSAQVYNDAVIQYNKGVANFKSNPDSAIIYFENCLKTCAILGDTTLDIQSKTIQVLPDLYSQKAYSLLTEKKIEESLAAAKIALEVSNKYQDDANIEKLQKMMVQAYSSMGTKFFAANENDKALAAFDSVLTINPDYSKSIYNKALVYKKMNNAPKFGETIDLYESKLNPATDTAAIQQANKLALDFYRSAGSKANKENKLDDAIALLTTSLKYGTDAAVYYQFASVQNKQKKFAEAAESAQKGLDMAVAATPEEKARFYYELAVAQVGKGDTASACESFKNSMFGPFLEASKAQRTNLKCK
jgi:tetratricopeptide (TPR) repeat protein